MRNEPPIAQRQNAAYPFAEEEARLARQSWWAAHATPKAAILISKITILLMFIGLAVSIGFNFYLAQKAANTKTIVVRVNDVGRAEAVRLDTAYVPAEPELRYQIEEFTTRYYQRDGFSVPAALDLLQEYLAPKLFMPWAKSLTGQLNDIAAGNNLKRVRILSCRILDPSLASTRGTTAVIRVALDSIGSNGALLNKDPEGWEVTMDFKTGSYPSLTDQQAKDQWVVRNPLGIQVLGIQETRYIGADVADPNAARIIDLAKERAEAGIAETDRGAGRYAPTPVHQDLATH